MTFIAIEPNTIDPFQEKASFDMSWFSRKGRLLHTQHKNSLIKPFVFQFFESIPFISNAVLLYKCNTGWAWNFFGSPIHKTAKSLKNDTYSRAINSLENDQRSFELMYKPQTYFSHTSFQCLDCSNDDISRCYIVSFPIYDIHYYHVSS